MTSNRPAEDRACWFGNSRWQSYLTGMSPAEAENYGVDQSQCGYFVCFGVSKTNYGAPFKERWFRRNEGGVLTLAVLELGKNRRARREEI